MDNDYIQTLSYEERLIFIRLFCKIIKADGNIDSGEIEFLKAISARYGVDNQTIVNIIKGTSQINVAAEAEKISDRGHALELIKELCVLSNIDEDAADNELDIIIDAARAMGIEDEKVILINRWVLDSLILNKTGNIIMERSNG